MLSRVSANLLSTPTSTYHGALLTAQRLLQTTISSSSSEVQGTPGGGTGAPGSKGAAPGRAGDTGTDEQVKFGDADACKTPAPSCWMPAAAHHMVLARIGDMQVIVDTGAGMHLRLLSARCIAPSMHSARPAAM